MKSTFEQLTPKKRELLARLYDSELYPVLKELLELERLNIATKLIDVPANDVITISKHQGRADFAKQLNLGLKRNFKESNKDIKQV